MGRVFDWTHGTREGGRVMKKNETVKPEKKKKRKSPAGIATNDLILSAHLGTNEALFPIILKLYVPRGATVADVTYGRGVFWRKVEKDKYNLLKTDLATGDDCRELKYKSQSIDCVVLDPPYMHISGGTAHVGHQNFEAYYKNNDFSGNGHQKKYHEAVLDLYFKAGKEAKRVLKHGGIFIVKCQDEVCANKQRLTHIELTNEFVKRGFVVEDLFVLVRNGKPGVSRMLKQIHARKNHSYFMVYRKNGVVNRRRAAKRGSSRKRTLKGA